MNSLAYSLALLSAIEGVSAVGATLRVCELFHQDARSLSVRLCPLARTEMRRAVFSKLKDVRLDVSCACRLAFERWEKGRGRLPARRFAALLITANPLSSIHITL